MEFEDTNIDITPIGIVCSPRKSKRDDKWGAVESAIKLDGERFEPAAPRGLGDFSHVEVIFYMHRVCEQNIESGSRHPRNNEN